MQRTPLRSLHKQCILVLLSQHGNDYPALLNLFSVNSLDVIINPREMSVALKFGGLRRLIGTMSERRYGTS
jgi:hypothetical protein